MRHLGMLRDIFFEALSPQSRWALSPRGSLLQWGLKVLRDSCQVPICIESKILSELQSAARGITWPWISSSGDLGHHFYLYTGAAAFTMMVGCNSPISLAVQWEPGPTVCPFMLAMWSQQPAL